jgi:maltoporin
MYGRMGVAWTLRGQFIQGATMNLTTERALGGRFEEGDYLEPTITAHILKKDKDKPDDTYIDFVFTPAMFARNGSFLGFFSNPTDTLRIELFQAYVEAGNVFIPDLIFWGGARFYRGSDVHIADYFYFNDLSSQGGGVKYKGAELAYLLHSAPGSPLYDVDPDPTDNVPAVKRQRSMITAQYTHGFGAKGSNVQGLGEVHLLPSARAQDGTELAPFEHGLVIGAKLHLDFGDGWFNDVSVRYGSRIANGSWGGSRTFQTFGPGEPNGQFDGAYGLEVVDHFLLNLSSLFTINGYGALNLSKSAVGPGDITPAAAAAGTSYRTLNWAAGVRGFLYAHDQFHMIAEATYQGRKDGDDPMGTAVKLSVVPTIVPTGEKSAWGRPHFRAIYTAGFYNQNAVDAAMSPYLRAVGPRRVAHYIGARTEWWF